MDIHNQTQNTSGRPAQSKVAIRYGLCIALSAGLLIGGALLAADRPSGTQHTQGKASGARAAQKTDRPSPMTSEDGLDFGIAPEAGREAGLPDDVCRNEDTKLQAARPDSSWVDREIPGMGVDIGLSHPPAWTAENFDGLGAALAAPSGDLEVLVTATVGAPPADVAEGAAIMMSQLPDIEVRASGLVELSGVRACHLVVNYDAGEMVGEAEMWLALPDGEAVVLILAVSFGEASGSDWAAARGIAGTLAVKTWA